MKPPKLGPIAQAALTEILEEAFAEAGGKVIVLTEPAEASPEDVAELVRQTVTDMMRATLGDEAPRIMVGAVIAGVAMALTQEMWERFDGETKRRPSALLSAWNEMGAIHVAQLEAMEQADG